MGVSFDVASHKSVGRPCARHASRGAEIPEYLYVPLCSSLQPRSILAFHQNRNHPTRGRETWDVAMDDAGTHAHMGRRPTNDTDRSQISRPVSRRPEPPHSPPRRVDKQKRKCTRKQKRTVKPLKSRSASRVGDARTRVGVHGDLSSSRLKPRFTCRNCQYKTSALRPNQRLVPSGERVARAMPELRCRATRALSCQLIYLESFRPLCSGPPGEAGFSRSLVHHCSIPR